MRGAPLMPRYRQVPMSRYWPSPVVLPDVREVPLRGSGNLRQRLSSWRGRSGRCYVVSVHTIAVGDVPEAPGAVILGVRRDFFHTGHIVGAGHRGTVAEAIALCGPDGASEIHLHHLAATNDERDAIVADLVDADDL